MLQKFGTAQISHKFILSIQSIPNMIWFEILLKLLKQIPIQLQCQYNSRYSAISCIKKTFEWDLDKRKKSYNNMQTILIEELSLVI